MSRERHHVVIVGGGFGGLVAARKLGGAPVDVTLVDRRNFHLFQPLLYQVATGGLSPANIAAPLRWILRKQRNTRVHLAEATGVDPERKVLKLRDGEMDYDTLIIAPGSQQNFFGNDHWRRLAPGLKSIEDATEIRRRVLLAFEAAERETDPDRIAALLTFIVVGGGPTGVELAGAISELARDTLRHDFRSIDTSRSRVHLVEGLDRLLLAFSETSSQNAKDQLEDLGVTVELNSFVTHIEPDHVIIKEGDDERRLDAHSVFWCAGVQATPIAQAIADATGAELDKVGRIKVRPDLSIPEHPDLFVIGDLAHHVHPDHLEVDDGDGTVNPPPPTPALAPAAMQMGRYVAKLVRRRIKDKGPKAWFRYKHKGDMATIGRSAAVAERGRIKIKGFLAWVGWLWVHLTFLVERQNRFLVLTQWAWHYITHNRSARLITGKAAHQRVIPTKTGRLNLAELAPQLLEPTDDERTTVAARAATDPATSKNSGSEEEE